MKKAMAIVVMLLFSVSSISINNEAEERKNEKVIAEIIYKSNESLLPGLQPTVVITSPEDGAVVTDPHLVVLGYASDESGMNYWEWEWHYEGGSKGNSSYFETAEYVEFRIDIYGLHPGWNLVIVRFKNIYGAIGEDSVNVTYNPPDNQPPTVTVDEPENGATFSNPDIHLRGVARDNVGVTQIGYTQEWEGGGTGSSWPVDPPATSHSFDIPITLHEGDNKITVEASDAAGNTGKDVIVVKYTPDTEPPVVIIEFPEDGAIFTDSNINVTGVATDNVGIIQINYVHEWKNGSTHDSWPISPPQSSYHFDIPITLHEGENTITVEARDEAGNTGSDEVSVTYVKENLSADADGPYYGKINEAIQFHGSASGGIPPYTWQWNFGDGDTSNQQNPKHAYGKEGNYQATLTVRDSIGNVATDTATVYIYTADDQSPFVEITKPRKGLYINDRKIMPLPLKAIVIGSVTVNVNASDNIGIAKVEFYIDSELKHTNYTMPYYWLWNETTIGKHTIKVIAYDFAGNTATDEQKAWIFNV